MVKRLRTLLVRSVRFVNGSRCQKASAKRAAISAEAYADANAHPSGNDNVGADDDVEG
jgi:hypothetical protein